MQENVGSVEKFTEDDRQELVHLLRKMKADMRSNPDPAKRDFLPDGVFEEIHGLVSMWAPEIVMTRTGPHRETQIYLTQYDGGVQEFQGTWNIPGGYNCYSEDSISESVIRIAKREIGLDLSRLQSTFAVMAAKKWNAADRHPIGRPLSLFVRSTTPHELEESRTGRFFSVSNLPDTLCGVHRQFVTSRQWS